MLTDERYEKILKLLKKQNVAKLAELVEATGASESTIRRDLSELESRKKLKRIHGGASLLKSKTDEPTMIEKKDRYTEEKAEIGRRAASLIDDGDCIFIDAGTTTEALLPFVEAKQLTVVSNGVNIITESLAAGFHTYGIGGYVKSGTRAFVGKMAAEALMQFRFDKAFLGTNGIDQSFGYSTPDPEEAHVKGLAINQTSEAYVLADASKFKETSFAKFADLQDAFLLTATDSDPFLDEIEYDTNGKVVRLS
ncbi:DeoR/GlpR family DNA-binding transcription regulator [Salisediminibacterium halotolerans]|uniref:DeoR/GlpR family DNA-binding transcription regulator n=1 Tax=Salisediminibacterium halotolerans TaxID=517425 RepID=UPI000EB34ED9|nr:DeoR/GlpR family DNA-binding transcription regulator [Salisediminibacterium halotolerans]RLJ80891.1 DeoR family transcriptional regulator [Actinophytocola xinjiangensis]RPE83923.1 DeoR family transcriptional regulator [Salisediminibacterium halotolerans]TWG37835.1 DeoR family transcriptional regulator [Salisediminibacterium halotolerans]GEL08460.1 DeoR family transcriptional regulator [Salisediminibacterium halotolerans]